MQLDTLPIATVMLKSIYTLFIVLAIFLSGPAVWSQQEIRSTHRDQKKIAITVYTNDLALVKDQRQVNLKKGSNTLAFMDVSTGIQPETALLHNLSHPADFSVIEQNYEFDALTAQALLQKHVGREVGVLSHNPHTGEKTIEQATLLAANEGVVLRFEDRIETGIALDRLIYQEIPKNLRERPTLLLQLHTPITGEQELELSYLTTGLHWKTDYVAELNQTEDRLDLKGWVTLSNHSGIPYQNARLQLVAGELHRVSPAFPISSARLQSQDIETRAKAVSREKEPLLDYHLYTLERSLTIKNNQSKQVALLSAHNIAVRKQYELQSHIPTPRHPPDLESTKLPVTVYLRFKNSNETGLGIPLPSGVFRVYKPDATGSAQFIGEDQIPPVLANAMTTIKLGQALDITAEKRWVEYRKLDANAFEMTFEIQLYNTKSTPITVDVVEFIPDDWHILSEDSPHIQKTANRAIWELPVPAKGQTMLTVSLRVRI